MSTLRNHEPKDLFLLRIWTEWAADSAEGGENMAWRGKVRRVVDGEEHQFSDWQALIDLLLTMVSGSAPPVAAKDLATGPQAPVSDQGGSK